MKAVSSKNKIILYLAFLLVLVPSFFQASAADTVICACCNTNTPCTFQDFFTVTDALITYIRNIAFFVAVLMIIKGGAHIMMSEGKPAEIQKGRDTLTWALIGMFAVFGSWLIITAVLIAISGGSITSISSFIH